VDTQLQDTFGENRVFCKNAEQHKILIENVTPVDDVGFIVAVIARNKKYILISYNIHRCEFQNLNDKTLHLSNLNVS